jgi:uncharacterized FlgJ-related protein
MRYWLPQTVELCDIIRIENRFLHQERFNPLVAFSQVRITKERVWIHRNEVVDSYELSNENKLEFFSYTYKVQIEGNWIPLVRFDNWEIGSHFDKYDENGSLVTQKQCPERSLEDVARLAKEFRRNLVTMDISSL